MSDTNTKKYVNKYRVDENGNIYEGETLIIPHDYDKPLVKNVEQNNEQEIEQDNTHTKSMIEKILLNK